jgi:hypothetical protein
VRGRSRAAAAPALVVLALFACGKATSQDPAVTESDGGGIGPIPDYDAAGGASCAAADSLAKACCGSGEPPATACAANWASEQLCAGGTAFTQTLFPTPCDGFVASNDAYGGGIITVFDAATGKMAAIVRVGTSGLGLCAASDDPSLVIPAECLQKWEAPGTAPCKPASAASFVTLCSTRSLPPQTCFNTAGSPACPVPTTCAYPASGTCSLEGSCLVPQSSCSPKTTQCACATTGGAPVTVCGGFAPEPAAPCSDGG